jgi:23S rRNA (cytidine1920-2'-O)/16S rRNA (cytidine1409-2'-O)-methyltransferase
VFLVKPQFEAGRASIGKGGILRDPEEGPPIAEEIARWLGTVPAWRVLGVTASPIAGGHGNREFLLGATKDQA